MRQIHEVATAVSEGFDEEADFIFAADVDDGLGEEIRVGLTVLFERVDAVQT